MKKEHEEWLQEYVESGDAVLAVERVYPHIQVQSRATKASYLKNLLASDIDNAARNQYGKDAPLMMSIIKDLAINGKQEAVRGKMADTWLSRAGHDATQVLEIKETATHEQLLERLKIATQGINPALLANALPKELLSQLAGKDHEETKH